MTHLAGWLFADLLLVMVLVVLGGHVIAPDDPPVPIPVPSPSPSPSGAGSRQTGMRPQSLDLTGLGDAETAAALTGEGGSRAAAQERVLARLRAKLRKIPDRVAMVFVWGSYGGCPGCSPQTRPSTAYAGAVEEFVREARLPRMPTPENFYRAYHDLAGHSGDLRLEIFVYYPD
ncbi:hypothetical protein ACF09Y_09450 [Streptomyces massasporeus]|uniref:hypothetical protein n=1 Tax=Streptomyces massasporeus TaxID=67324 RepID=UPI0036F5CF58